MRLRFERRRRISIQRLSDETLHCGTQPAHVVRLSEKLTVVGNLSFGWPRISRREEQLHFRPALMNGLGKLQTVH